MLLYSKKKISLYIICRKENNSQILCYINSTWIVESSYILFRWKV